MNGREGAAGIDGVLLHPGFSATVAGPLADIFARRLRSVAEGGYGGAEEPVKRRRKKQAAATQEEPAQPEEVADFAAADGGAPFEGGQFLFREVP